MLTARLYDSCTPFAATHTDPVDLTQLFTLTSRTLVDAHTAMGLVKEVERRVFRRVA